MKKRKKKRMKKKKKKKRRKRKNKKRRKKKTIKDPPTHFASSQFISNFVSSLQIVLAFQVTTFLEISRQFLVCCLQPLSCLSIPS